MRKAVRNRGRPGQRDVWRRAGVAALVWLVAASAGAQPGRPVELELVLAVDISASVDVAEYRLQMAGIAGAFRDPAVIAAIEAHGEAGIAVAMVQWARDAAMVVDWRHLADGAAAARIAAEIEGQPRAAAGVTTGIGSALALSGRLLATNGFAGRRRVIDVSGDGRNNAGLPLAVERARVIGAGVTVNGLAILDDDPTLEGYYLGHVAGGPGAFVLTADDFGDFARAFREKLLREILTLVAGGAEPGSTGLRRTLSRGGAGRARRAGRRPCS